jgi:murein L,D-transpeptidase YafK
MNKLLLASMIWLYCSVIAAATPLLADRVVVAKAEKTLYLLKDGVRFKAFPIALGPKPRGHKLKEGDERTPEGSYILDFKNEESDFYKSIHISYPNQQDVQRAAASGVDPGGFIMIHGIPNQATLPVALIQTFNWTDGCIAVTNPHMDEIWLAVEPGTPIDILP